MHRIRLGSAWRLHVPARHAGSRDADSEGGDILFDLPAQGELLQGVADSGAIELRRFFNRPSNLDGGERVTLAFTGLTNRAGITLNDVVLRTASASDSSSTDAISFDIRDKLRPRNELIVALSNPSSFRQPGAIILETVTLEIESDPDDERK